MDAINWFKKKRDEIEAEEITIEAKVIDKFSIMRKDKLHRSTKQWLQHYNENEYMKHVDFYMVFKLKDGKNIEWTYVNILDTKTRIYYADFLAISSHC